MNMSVTEIGTIVSALLAFVLLGVAWMADKWSDRTRLAIGACGAALVIVALVGAVILTVGSNEGTVEPVSTTMYYASMMAEPHQQGEDCDPATTDCGPDWKDWARGILGAIIILALYSFATWKSTHTVLPPGG